MSLEWDNKRLQHLLIQARAHGQPGTFHQVKPSGFGVSGPLPWTRQLEAHL